MKPLESRKTETSTFRYQYSLVLVFLLLTCFGCAKVSTYSNQIVTKISDTKGNVYYQRGDYPNALTEYQKSADKGGSYGQFKLANMYLKGEAVKPDKNKAISLMQKSAEGGYPSANYAMGMACLSGNIVKLDPAKAAQYFKHAAAQGHAPSMHILGLMTALGLGTVQNTDDAIHWFRLARAQGFPIQDELLSKASLTTFIKKNRHRSAKIQKKAIDRQRLVREIQQNLTSLGYDPGPIDGLFGKKTRTAIQKFQQKQGLKEDGQATTKLLKSLKQAH